MTHVLLSPAFTTLVLFPVGGLGSIPAAISSNLVARLTRHHGWVHAMHFGSRVLASHNGATSRRMLLVEMVVLLPVSILLMPDDTA